MYFSLNKFWPISEKSSPITKLQDIILTYILLIHVSQVHLSPISVPHFQDCSVHVCPNNFLLADNELIIILIRHKWLMHVVLEFLRYFSCLQFFWSDWCILASLSQHCSTIFQYISSINFAFSSSIMNQIAACIPVKSI